MFSGKRKDISRLTNKAPPRDFRAEFNQVISQIHAKRKAAHDELGGRLHRLEGPRDMEVVCVKNSQKRNDTPAGMGFHFGSILGYSTEHVNVHDRHRVEIGEGRSDFAEMKRKLELSLNRSCRFKQHANIASNATLKDAASEMMMLMTSAAAAAAGSDDHDDSDSARGRSASSSGSCHSANESISGSEVDEADSQQDPDELLLDKFANECKISLSTAPMKPTVIHIDTPLKENFRDEEFIEANNDILAADRRAALCHATTDNNNNIYADDYEDVAVESAGGGGFTAAPTAAAAAAAAAASSAASTAVVEECSDESSAVSAWLAKRGVVLEDCDAPRIVSVSRVEDKSDQIKVVKRRFLKHDPKRRRADNVASGVSTDSQYSSDESTDAVKSSEASGCSDFSESRDTVILGGRVEAEAEAETEAEAQADANADANNNERRKQAKRQLESQLSHRTEGVVRNTATSDAPVAVAVTVATAPAAAAAAAAPSAEEDRRISASSAKEERSEKTVDLRFGAASLGVYNSANGRVNGSGNASKVSSVVVVCRPKKSVKAIRAHYDRHLAVEDDLIEVLPSVRRLAHMFRFEGEPSDVKNKYHSLTGRSLSKEFRQKQLRPKPSLPRSARFDEALPMERPRGQLQKIAELAEAHDAAQCQAELSKAVAKSQTPPPPPTTTPAPVAATAAPVEGKKKKSRSRAVSCKGFFDREILARLSKFQQFI